MHRVEIKQFKMVETILYQNVYILYEHHKFNFHIVFPYRSNCK